MISLDKKLILIILLWLIVLLILPINGNYLINDSYVYVWNVQNSLKTLTLHPLTSPTVIFQTFLGTLIYKLLEPNPALLRLLTYFLVLICTLTFYKLAVILNFKKNYALIVSVLLLFNPLTLTLGASFMSEIYFLTTLILAMYFSVKYKLTNQFNFLFLTSVFLSFSFLSRQIALIPIIAGLFILFKR